MTVTLKNASIWIVFWALLGLPALCGAEEPADELYKQGRFAEAEKAYAQADMDHPKDVRFRYNRGCAAYQNADHEGAVAAFSSVMRRAEDDEIRFKAAFNLGNASFKRGDLMSAVTYYREALLLDPESEDARYNMELVLREIEKQKNKKDPDSQQQGQNEPDPDGKKPDESADNGKHPDGAKEEESPRDESADKEQKEDQDRQDQTDKQEAGQQNPSQDKREESEEAGQGESRDGQRPDPKRSKDLSGGLQPMEALPEEPQADESAQTGTSAVDRKRAEALLDNIQEDRSRFLRLHIPQDKRSGVASGKDW
jgi:Ca-activated chloride channel family protein